MIIILKLKRIANCSLRITIEDTMYTIMEKKGKGKLGAIAMKRVAAGAQLLTPSLFGAAIRPDDRADYWLDCSFLPQ